MWLRPVYKSEGFDCELVSGDRLENSNQKRGKVVIICADGLKHLTLHARLALYQSLILPLFDYGDIWGDKNNATSMNNLQIQQNKAAKIILDKAKYCSATNALEILKWKRLDERRHMHRCVLFLGAWMKLLTLILILSLILPFIIKVIPQYCIAHPYCARFLRH